MFATKLPAGVSKSDMAIKLFGKTGLDFLDFLGLSNAQLAALNQTLDASGYTLKDTSGAEAAKREWNLFDMVLQGLDNTLTVQLLPTIRQVLATATGIIVTNGKQIVAVLTDITQSVLGFITGLLGLDAAVPFQAQLDGLGASVEHVTLTKEEWAEANGRLIPTIDDRGRDQGRQHGDRQRGQVDRQADRALQGGRHRRRECVRAHDDAARAVYQAQLDALDLQDKQDAAAQRAHDLNERLNQAQLDLAKAQGGDPKTGVVDAEAVSSAMKAVADVRAEQAKNTLQEQRDAQRASLQSTKDFIAEQATLAGDTTVTQTTKIKTFTQREGALTSSIDVAKEKGDAATVADLTARLEAVRTAKARAEQANRAIDRQAELGDIKARLADQRAAIASADSSEVAANKKTLAQLNADYNKYLADNKLATTNVMALRPARRPRRPEDRDRPRRAISKSFSDGRRPPRPSGSSSTSSSCTATLSTSRQDRRRRYRRRGGLAAGAAALNSWGRERPRPHLPGASLGATVRTSQPGATGPRPGLSAGTATDRDPMPQAIGQNVTTAPGFAGCRRVRAGMPFIGIGSAAGVLRPRRERHDHPSSRGPGRDDGRHDPLHTHIDLDGREVADVVSRYQADDYRR